MDLKNTLGEKYRGILYNTKFDNLSFDEQLETLVKNKIYIEYLPFDFVFTVQYNRKKNLNYNFYTVPNKNLSCYEIDYRGVKYSLNENLLIDIFNYMGIGVSGDDYVFENIYDPQQKILNHLSKLLTDNEKFNFCVNKYNEFYSKIENIDEIVYYDNDDEEITLTWEEFIVSEIRYNFELIKKHLFSIYHYETDFVPIFKKWRELYHSTEMMSYLKSLMLKFQTEPVIYKNIDLSFQISMFEEILNINDWSEMSATKKGKILSHLLNKNKDNIRNVYLELEKKQINVSKKILDDRIKATELIKTILG